ILNESIKLLIEKELEEKNLASINTINYLREQLNLAKNKVDSSSLEYQKLQKSESIYDIGGKKGEILGNIVELERQKVDYNERISALNSVSNNVFQSGLKGMVDLNIAGLNEGNFISEVSSLKQLEDRKKELLLLYQPGARDVVEIEQQIQQTKSRIQNTINASRNKLNKELADINKKLSEYDQK